MRIPKVIVKGLVVFLTVAPLVCLAYIYGAPNPMAEEREIDRCALEFSSKNKHQGVEEECRKTFKVRMLVPEKDPSSSGFRYDHGIEIMSKKSFFILDGNFSPGVQMFFDRNGQVVEYARMH